MRLVEERPKWVDLGLLFNYDLWSHVDQVANTQKRPSHPAFSLNLRCSLLPQIVKHKPQTPKVLSSSSLPLKPPNTLRFRGSFYNKSCRDLQEEHNGGILSNMQGVLGT